ncbi:MAG: hypothetical protein V1716_00945 [Candidatus Uhrbacteria bacterium]
MSAKIAISSLHEKLLTECKTASEQLGFADGRLPLWIALALTRFLFTENLAEKIIANLVKIGALSRSEPDYIVFKFIPPVGIRTAHGIPVMPDNWLERLRVALRENKPFQNFSSN